MANNIKVGYLNNRINLDINRAVLSVIMGRFLN